MKIRISKEFEIEMAHSLFNYEGKCKFIHGHSYKMIITAIGTPLQNENSPKNGMVCDFKILKELITKNIVDKFDHSFVINKNSDFNNSLLKYQMFNNIHVVDFQPTCENLTIHFVEIIKQILPNYLELLVLRLYETTTSFAEWNKFDN